MGENESAPNRGSEGKRRISPVIVIGVIFFLLVFVAASGILEGLVVEEPQSSEEPQTSEESR